MSTFRAADAKPLLTLPRYPRVFEKGDCSFQDFGGIVPTFESNIVYPLRFMIDRNVRTPLAYPAADSKSSRLGCWYELDRSSSWQIHPGRRPKEENDLPNRN
jgi:hypothetical protein